ncbi:MAG: stage II sporulation protein R [Oscillospiraceae bacterium]|nr:stage II sporulation protein R [Oscillospiraceae bacterium]
MKQAIRMLLLLLLAGAAASLSGTEHALEGLEHSVIRLHILADSDSTADQTQKLLVRDAVLQQSGRWIPEKADFTAGCEAIKAALPQIQKTAEETLLKAGCSDSVKVSFSAADFPARSYGDLTLPAGTYQALRVEIGSAAGQNWWCVMYPALCIPAAAGAESCGFPDGVLPPDSAELAAEPERYEVRLKCVDAVRAAVRRIRSCFPETENPASPEGRSGISDVQR